MQRWNNTAIIWLLALLCLFGIIMMLLLDGIWDVVMLVITLCPLFIAFHRFYKMNRLVSKNEK